MRMSSVVANASAAAESADNTYPAERMRRRSMRSESIPAGTVRTSRGRKSAAVMRLTISGEPVIISISHGPAVNCRYVPRCPTVPTSQSLR